MLLSQSWVYTLRVARRALSLICAKQSAWGNNNRSRRCCASVLVSSTPSSSALPISASSASILVTRSTRTRSAGSPTRNVTILFNTIEPERARAVAGHELALRFRDAVARITWCCRRERLQPIAAQFRDQ